MQRKRTEGRKLNLPSVVADFKNISGLIYTKACKPIQQRETKLDLMLMSKVEAIPEVQSAERQWFVENNRELQSERKTSAGLSEKYDIFA